MFRLNNYLVFNLYTKKRLFLKFGIKESTVVSNNVLENKIELFWNLWGVKKDFYMKSLFLKKKNLIDNGSYIGYRIIRGLPLRNQRTHTNAKTTRKYL